MRRGRGSKKCFVHSAKFNRAVISQASWIAAPIATSMRQSSQDRFFAASKRAAPSDEVSCQHHYRCFRATCFCRNRLRPMSPAVLHRTTLKTQQQLAAPPSASTRGRSCPRRCWSRHALRWDAARAPLCTAAAAGRHSTSTSRGALRVSYPFRHRPHRTAAARVAARPPTSRSARRSARRSESSGGGACCEPSNSAATPCNLAPRASPHALCGALSCSRSLSPCLPADAPWLLTTLSGSLHRVAAGRPLQRPERRTSDAVHEGARAQGRDLRA